MVRGHRRTLAQVALPAGTGLACWRAGSLLAVLLGVAALVLVNRRRYRGHETSAATDDRHKQRLSGLFVDDADKALCEVIGPLMQEETDRGEGSHKFRRARFARAQGSDSKIQG